MMHCARRVTFNMMFAHSIMSSYMIDVILGKQGIPGHMIDVILGKQGIPGYIGIQAESQLNAQLHAYIYLVCCAS